MAEQRAVLGEPPAPRERLVHRDVKPGNVILCERGGLSDVAKVVDFGLVKDLEADGAMTHDTTMVGTPLYLAPEAIRSPTRAPI